MQLTENQIKYRFRNLDYIVCLKDGFLYQLAHCPKKRTKVFRKLKYNQNRQAYYINGVLVTKKRLQQLKISPTSKMDY